MKKKTIKYFVGIVLGVMLFSLAGCGESQPMDVSGTENETMAASSAGTMEEAKDTSEIVESIVEETVPESSEEFMEAAQTPEESAAESFDYWDAYCNYNPLDLTPIEGDFMVLDPEPEDAFPYLSSPDGEVFGFYDDLTDGCSVWCAIDYESYVNRITATSTLAPQGNHNYNAENLGNRWRGDAWVEGVEGNGIGESVTIVRKYSHGGDSADFQDYGYDSFFFPTLCIVNGMAKDEKSWKNNGRVKSMKLYFNEEYIATLEMEDSMRPQFISLSGLHLSARDGEESSFRFEIADVYPGDKYEDTALTGIEIEVFTENH